MDRFRNALAAILIFLALPIALAQENPIVTQLDAFKQAYDAGDADAIAGFYTENGALLPPQGNPLVGKEAIAAHYAAAFSQGVSNLQLKILEINQLGPDSILEIGVTQVALKDQKINGRYVHIWKREGDRWLLHRDMYQVLSIK